MKFEDFISEFSADALSHQQFLFNALLAALLSWLLGVYYRRFGNSVANRSHFSKNFMLLALATMLIIYIVKSSVALSLGLVGALSIVRFRAAIKEPEELVYLFLVIGIGLGMGANQAVITVLAFILIMILVTIQQFSSRKLPVRSPENMFVNISTKATSVQAINEILAQHFTLVELKRMDHYKGQLDLSYLVETQNVDNVQNAKDQLIKADSDLNFSFIEHRNLAL